MTLKVDSELRQVAIILEDDAFQLKVMELALDKLGIDSKGVTTSKDFFKELENPKANLFFIDLNLERVGEGFEVIRKIREAHRSDAVIFVISAEDKPSIFAHALECGADDFLVKPIDLILLGNRLGSFVRTDEIDYINGERSSVVLHDPALVSFEIEIEEISNLGIRFYSPHLLLKSVNYEFEGPLWKEILGVPSVKLSVNSTEVVQEPVNCYRISAQFAFDDQSRNERIRNWLKKNKV